MSDIPYVPETKTHRGRGCTSLGRASFVAFKDGAETWFCIDCHTYFDTEVKEMSPNAQ